MNRLCRIHGKVERYNDGHCKECRRAQLRNRYARKKEEYKSRRAVRMKDPAYRTRQADTQRKSVWKSKGLPKPTRPAPVICECCGRAPKVKRLALDHNHETGRFRGWLCSECNLGLGKLGDTIDALNRARAYLIRAELA